jgi:deoxyadenosine/deoxycytidine kinase
MFAQMANSLKYKKAADRIRENEVAQNYILNAQQFGLIANYFFLQIQAVAGLDPDVALNGSIPKILPQKNLTEHNFITDNYSPEHFQTYGKAWSNILNIVDNKFFNPLNDLTIGERVEASVVVATGLSIAFITQQRNEINELISPEVFRMIIR